MPNGRQEEDDSRSGKGLLAAQPARTPLLKNMLDEVEPAETCYRYRTSVLVGPWRARREEARADAVRACQARIDPGLGFSWNVEGRIEKGHPAPHDEDPRDLVRH